MKFLKTIQLFIQYISYTRVKDISQITCSVRYARSLSLLLTGSKPTVAVKPQTHTTPVDKVGDIHINHNLSEEQSHDSQYVLNTIYSEYSGNGNTSGAVTNTDNLANGSRAKGQVTGPGTTQGPVVQNKNAEKNIYENVKMKTNSLTKSKDRQSKPPRTKSDDDITNATDDEGEDIYNTEDIYASYRSLEPSSILDDFQKSLLASLVSGRLGTEFAVRPH